MIVVAHVRGDETVAHRTALMPSEIAQVVAALTMAAQTLSARRPQHRTVSGSEAERELERKLF
ncbi:MAG: hypothetical protein WDO69_24400 [Pseudomonadota bacterium]